MFRALLIFGSVLGLSMPAAAQDKEGKLPENTIDCKQFKKSGPREWIEVGTAVFDLGKVRDINLTDQPVTPGYFRFGGIELYAVLDGKCGAAAYVNRGRKDQAGGDFDSALANFNQAIRLDPKLAEAYDSRGGIYDGKGDYARAIADYDEALKLDPKLESATNHRAIAQEKLAKASASNTQAEPQITLEQAGAVLKEGLDASPDASKTVQTPEKTGQEQASKQASQAQVPEQMSQEEAPKQASQERVPEQMSQAQVPEQASQAQVSEQVSQEQAPEQASQEQAAPTPENKTVSLKIQSEDGACRAKKLVYAANGAGDAEKDASVFEVIFEGAGAEQSRDGPDSEFIIRESKNSEIRWAYKGIYIQKEKSGYFKFAESRRRKPVVLRPSYIKPNRDGTGEAILFLGGLDALLTGDNGHGLKFEGKRPTGVLPEVFYFDRCE